MKKKEKQFKKDKKQIFKFLQKGYFSFPLRDKGKKFELVDTYSVYLKDKNLALFLKEMKKHPVNLMHIYEDIFWKAIKQEKLDKKYKDCWLVPIYISELKDELMVDLDILKPVK